MSLRKGQVIALAQRWAELAQENATQARNEMNPIFSHSKGLAEGMAISHWHDAKELMISAGFTPDQITTLIGDHAPCMDTEKEAA